MDITVQREALLRPLQAISGVVEKKQTLPILSNVLLTLKDKNLLLTGTDLEVELIGFVNVEQQSGEGTLTVSARKLFDICRTLPEGSSLNLVSEKNYLVVRTGESCFRLNTLPAEDFPNLEASEYSVEFSLHQNHLKNLFAKTYFAMGQQDVRHYLNGIYLDIQPNKIKAVAADGHRLALASIEDESIGDVNANVILPRKSVIELIRLLGSDINHDIVIQIGDNRMRIESSEYIFTTKLINAQYPDYNRIIPRGTLTALGDRDSIKQALVRASILSSEKFRGVRLQFEPGKLRITANNSEQEHAEEVVALDYDGNNLEIGFNVAYLLDVFSALTAKTIRCVFSGPNEGIVLKADNEDSIYVIMPMRL